MAQTITKNGKAYDSSGVSLELLGYSPNEVYEVSYNTEQAHQKNYSLGSSKPTSWSKGNIEHNGTITLAMSDQVGIERAARKAGIGLVTDIPPFDIVVQYFDEFNELVQDVITCKFQNTGRNVGGDMSLRYQYTLFVIDIQYNKAL